MINRATRYKLNQLIRRFYNLSSFSPLFLSIPITVLLLSKPALIADSTRLVRQDTIPQELTLLFVGDIMQHMPQVDAAWDESRHDYIYYSCFSYVKPVIEGYDLAIANFETTLAGKPYSGYPAFSSPDELVKGVRNAGIDIAGTANNHCCDRGRTGIERTLKIMDSLGLKHLGTYRSLNEYRKANPMIIRKNGFTIALLNYTYGTNMNPVPEGDVVSLIEKDRILCDLTAARDSQPDKVILFMHWGEEYQREPNAFQKDIANFCFENGADIIIGSHPHVIQPMEWYKADSLHKERLVVWSLGNYVSNQRKRYMDGGAMFSMTLRKEKSGVSISKANYQLSWVYNPIRDGKRQYYILPVSRFEQDSTFMDSDSFAAMKLFASDSRELLKENIGIGEVGH